MGAPSTGDLFIRRVGRRLARTPRQDDPGLTVEPPGGPEAELIPIA